MQLGVLKSFTLVAAAASLVFISGCEDQEGRTNTSALKKTVQELRAEVSSMREEMDERGRKLDVFRKKMGDRIDLRMKEIANNTADLKIEIGTQVNDRSKEQSKNHLENLQRLREDFDKSLKTVLTVDVAGETRILRSEIEKVRVELIGFMDNQLKELYPYAYQPRRVDERKPPEAPQE